jgi:hypothetical protein
MSKSRTDIRPGLKAGLDSSSRSLDSLFDDFKVEAAEPSQELHKATDKKILELLKALTPLPALVFLTRCAMRSRFHLRPTQDWATFLAELAEYDASLHDATSLCLRPESWEQKLVSAQQIAEDEARQNQEHRNEYIQQFFKYCAYRDSDDSLLEPLRDIAFHAIESVGQALIHLDGSPKVSEKASPLEAAAPTVLPDLMKLIDLGTEEAIDPTEDGPLNGLWPNGAPKGYAEFVRGFALDLGLPKASLQGSIPRILREHGARNLPGGQAAEPSERDMNVAVTGGHQGQTLEKASLPELAGEARTIRDATPPYPVNRRLSDEDWRARLLGDGVSPLATEAYITFRHDYPTLLTEHRGEWVAYSGSKRLGFNLSGNTPLYKQFLSAGIQRRDLLVLRILPGMLNEIGVTAS